MSTQAGIWNFDGRPADPEVLEKLNMAIAEQSPQTKNIYRDGSIGMLYRPVHTTRESRFERQPLLSPRRFVMTWDGRLDNRDDLASQIQLNSTPQQPDAAIAMAAFEHWGTDCFHKLIGDWALSIWIPTEKMLILAKDFMGIRHLYYYLSDENVIWCTDLGSIVLLSESSFELDAEYVAGYLSAFPSAHLTPYREIKSVPPGSFVTIRPRKEISQRHWSFEPSRSIRYKADREYEEHFLHVFRQSVRRRLRSDSPILGELSGGIDSSSIICMADDVIAKGEVDTSRLDTISFYDPKEPGGDERPHIKIIEDKRGQAGYHFDRSQYGYTFPFTHHDFVAAPGIRGRIEGVEQDLLELIRSKGHRVILCGIGGDEFLGGVPNPEPQLADLVVSLRPGALVRELRAWSFVKKRPWIQLLFRTLVHLLPASIRAMCSEKGKVPPWVDARFARRFHVGARQLGPNHGYGFWYPSRREYAQTLVAMRRQIAHCSPHALGFEERRYPYLDQSLIEFLSSIPANQLLRPGQRRSLMRRSLVGIVPHEVLFRRTKGFTARAFVVALENTWPELENLFASPLSARGGYINKTRFLKAMQVARAGDPLQLLPLVKVLYLESWIRDLIVRGTLHMGTNTPICLDPDLRRQEA